MTIKKVGITITVLGLIGLAILQLRPKNNYRTAAVELAGQIITVEVVDGMASRAKGLSGHAPLTENQGMLFLFGKKDYQAIWMQGMSFAIDIIWLDNDTIVDMANNVLPPLPGEKNLPIYKPDQKADKVLELPAGWLELHNVTLGTKIKI